MCREEKLEQTSDKGFIEEAVKKIIETNPKAVSDYKNGKEEALQFLIGQVMRETRGKANPDALKETLIKKFIFFELIVKKFDFEFFRFRFCKFKPMRVAGVYFFRERFKMLEFINAVIADGMAAGQKLSVFIPVS